MMTMLAPSVQRRLRNCGWIAICALAVTALGAQTPAVRIRSEISSSELTPLKGSLHPRAQAQFDAGRVPADTRLNGISIVFSRSTAQQADLNALIAAQQDPASPLFHKWLNPDQFAARFGMAREDLDKVQSWLEQQGFSIDSVARSKNLIRFSGTVGQVEQAFQTQMHYYKSDGEKNFAPSTELSLPAALAPVVEAVRNLNDFRPKAMHITGNAARTRPAFSSSQSSSVFFAPQDIWVVYDFPKPVSGYIGTGQKIAIMGQSAILASDITNFQNAAELTPKAPTLVLVPSTGTSTVVTNDESESDLDLEWSSAMAPGADIYFVYTGNSTNNGGAFDSVTYAVDQDTAPIVSLSYGACEPDLGGFSLESTFQQAAAQGQTIINASGDSGSTACSGTTGLSAAQQEVIAVSYPASSPYVTGVGGTEVSQADPAYLTQGTTYWTSASGSDVITSALQYIPEVAWNDDAPPSATSNGGLGSSSGGASALFGKPSYQATLTPTDGARDVPDIALYSSPSYPGYLYCSSDTSLGISGSCSHGFRDSNNQYLTVAGGTSFAAPIFAGMLAIINQKAGYTTGQGLINPTLYGLATSGTAYTAAAGFHDITSGNNDCTAGSTFCSSTQGFSAGPGYDQVTGLGSVDLNLLATAWPANGSSALIDTSTLISASSTAPAVNASVNFTVTVTSDTGSTIPTGTVKLTVDGGASITENLTAGSYTYTTSFSTVGTHLVAASYSGDATHAASGGAVASVAVGSSSSGAGTFTLSASPSTVTVSQGNSGTSTITITSVNSYAGTVGFTLSTSNTSLQTYGCYTATNTPVVAASTATMVLTLYTSQTACNALPAVRNRAPHAFILSGARRIASSHGNQAFRTVLPVSAAALVGFLMLGISRRRAKWLNTLGCFILLGVVGLAVGCGGGSSSGSDSGDVATGTYSVTLVGTDTAFTNITTSLPMTLTVN